VSVYSRQDFDRADNNANVVTAGSVKADSARQTAGYDSTVPASGIGPALCYPADAVVHGQCDIRQVSNPRLTDYSISRLFIMVTKITKTLQKQWYCYNVE